MTEKTTKDKKERTLSLKPGLVSSTKAKGSRSPRASTVVVESRRGRLSQTRKPVAPSVRVRKAPAAPNVFKPKKENESLDKRSRNLTDSERVAREKALENAKIKDETEKLSKREKVVKKEKTIQSSPDTVDPANIPAKKDPELVKESAKNIKSESAASKKKDLKKTEKEKTDRFNKGEKKRRSGKLSISQALNEEERQRSLASIKRRQEKARKKPIADDVPKEKISRNVIIPEIITVQELSNRMAERGVDVIKSLMTQGVMVKINDILDSDTAQLIAEEFGHTVTRVSEADIEEGLSSVDDKDEDKKPRSPVVTVMGHVDHGKTTLLDAIRESNNVSGEAGGITQHIGAYQTRVKDNKKVTFIDTPGHAAFTSMRARGAKVTDIVVLVVAADDGVMPQTIEAINHAREAEAPIIVAINKIDKPDADPNATRNSLLQNEIVVEEMGGDIQSVELSALTKKGIDDLIEAILLQADLLELKANPDRPAEGFVIEAKLDKNRGPAVTTIIQRGTLRIGDILVIGQYSGKVRSLINDQGKVVKECYPGDPIEILGMSQTPEAGDILTVVESDSRAREVSEYRQRKSKAPTANLTKANLDQLFSKSNQTQKKEILIVVKADVQGSSEAIKEALLSLGNEEVSCRVIHVGAGAISESDITLAEASKALILGFNVRANNQAKEAAEKFGITILYHSIIYDLIDDVKSLLEGKLDPELRSTVTGMAEVLEVFKNSKVGNIAGCNVLDGKMVKGLHAKLLRDDVVIYDGLLSTLRRFKDDAKEVNAGQECGLSFDNNQDIRPGDKIECYKVDEIKRTI
ncbi:MAG: translation initiation factor IF-2 [Pseudomonadota bacterium]|nr:translation initiation factor IF-2 [Pseudomonadota bacterium]